VLVWSRNIGFQLITSGVLGVDTFFVLSGFLTAIIFAREVTKDKLSFRSLLLYYIHRYIRLTPAFLLVTLVSIHLTPYFGRGPVYPSVQGFETEGCHHRGWWTAILYIGNLFKGNEMCLPVSWYLYNDMQFHWIAPLALIPFVIGRKVIGFIVPILFVFVSIGSIVGIALSYPNMGLTGVTAIVTVSFHCLLLSE
jgi:peptidoglycan/LPS O-acetylase OafA/YrhL